MNKLDRYSMMIVANYFKNVNDYINMVLVTKNFEEIPRMFHYNPIELCRRALKLFTNVQTQHIYSSSNKIHSEYAQYVFHYEMDLTKANNLRQQYPSCQFKRVIYADSLLSPIPDFVTHIKICYASGFNIDSGSVVNLPQNFKSFIFDSYQPPLNSTLTFKLKKTQIIYSPIPLWFKPLLDNLKIECPNICLDAQSLSKPSPFDSCVSISPYAFQSYSNVNTFELPTSLTALENCAFANCTQLKSIKIPSSVLYLGERCFYNCTQLKSVSLPSSVVSLGRFCFACCCNLSEINIPCGIITISEGCFYNCSKLEGMTLPPHLKKIEQNAFRQCIGLTVNFPNSITSIAPNAFEKCELIQIPTHLV